MQVDVYADAMGFDVLRSEWNALLADSWADSLFLTWEWQHVWWRELGAGELRLLAARDDANRLLGIAPHQGGLDLLVGSRSETEDLAGLPDGGSQHGRSLSHRTGPPGALTGFPAPGSWKVPP